MRRCRVNKRGTDIEPLVKLRGVLQVNGTASKKHFQSLSFSLGDCCGIRNILLCIIPKYPNIIPVGYLSFFPNKKLAAQRLHIIVQARSEEAYLDMVLVLRDALGGTLSRTSIGRNTFAETLFYGGDKAIVIVPSPPEAFGANWVYFSLPTPGSRKMLSLYANAMGYKLRRNGLWFNGNRLSTPDADSFLRYLGLPRNFVEQSFDRLKDALYPLSCKLAEAARMAVARKKGLGRKREIKNDTEGSSDDANDTNKWWLTKKTTRKNNAGADSIKTQAAIKKIRSKGIRLNYLRVQKADTEEIY